MAFHRVAGLAGIAFTALVLAGAALLGDQPGIDESTAGIEAYLEQDRELHRASMVVGFLSLPFFAVFLGGVHAHLRANDAQRGEGWAASALVGGTLLYAIAVTGDVLATVLFLRGGEGLDGATVRALWDALWIVHGLIGVGVAGLAGSVAAVSIRRALWPRWYGWLSAVAAIVGFASVLGVAWASPEREAVTLAALLALMAWTLTTSALLYRRAPELARSP